MKDINYIKSMDRALALRVRLARALASHRRANGMKHRARAARQALRASHELDRVRAISDSLAQRRRWFR